MNSNTVNILNDFGLLKLREEYFNALTNTYEGKSNKVFFLNGVYGQSNTDPYLKPKIWVDEALDFLAERVDEIRDKVVFRPLSIEFGPYGVHFIDKIFGCNVYYNEDSDQWYNEYLEQPIGDLEYPDLDNDETWQISKRIARAFLKADVKVPLFGLPTIASAINVAINLYGQKILIALYTEPEKAKHDLMIINKLLCDLHLWYLDNIPLEQLQPVVSAHRTQPRGYGQICGCSNQLISLADYKEFFASLDDQLLSVYPNGGMIHLCGSHTQHIPIWREHRSFKAFQLNDRAAEDLEVYFNELRDDQIIYLNPTEIMNVEKALQITGGHRLVIVADYDKKIKCSCCSCNE